MIALEKGLRDRDRGTWTQARAWTDGKGQEQGDGNRWTGTEGSGLKEGGGCAPLQICVNGSQKQGVK